MPKLSHVLKTTVEKMNHVPNSLNLEYFSSTNFIGLFVSEACAPFLKQLTADFAEAAKKAGEFSFSLPGKHNTQIVITELNVLFRLFLSHSLST